MSDQQIPVRRSGDNTFWRWTGNVGNVIGLVGVIGSIIAGKPYLIILFVAIVGMSVGFWLMRQKWQRTGVAFLVVGLLCGLGAIVALLQPSPQSQPADQSANATKEEPKIDTSKTLTTETPQPVVDQQVILEPGQAVDVDTSNQPVADNQDGAVGAFDLYLRRKDNVLLAQDGFYTFQGSPNNAHHDCAMILAPGAKTASQYIPSITSTSGLSYCFTTSDKRIGWLHIDNTNVDGVTLVNDVLRVRVWDK